MEKEEASFVAIGGLIEVAVIPRQQQEVQQ
jgi:hypothetical protein